MVWARLAALAALAWAVDAVRAEDAEVQAAKVSEGDEPAPCEYLLFANGMKCGSTALYGVLVGRNAHLPPGELASDDDDDDDANLHDWLSQPGNPYVIDAHEKRRRNGYGGWKEKCWSRPPAEFKRLCTKARPLVVDGCPENWRSRHRGFAPVADHTTVVLLVRPQADILQSYYMTHASEYGGYTQDAADRFAEHNKDWEWLDFYKTYKYTTKMFKRVVVVHHDEVLSLAGEKRVVSAINALADGAYELQMPTTVPHANVGSSVDHRHGGNQRTCLSAGTRASIMKHFLESNMRFYNATGVWLE